MSALKASGCPAAAAVLFGQGSVNIPFSFVELTDDAGACNLEAIHSSNAIKSYTRRTVDAVGRLA